MGTRFRAHFEVFACPAQSPLVVGQTLTIAEAAQFFEQNVESMTMWASVADVITMDSHWLRVVRGKQD